MMGTVAREDAEADNMRTWLRLAMNAGVVRRSSRVALVVGTILVAINYGDRLISGELAAGDVVKMVLTYCVPYCVSTYAAVAALMAAGSEQRCG